MPTQDWGVYPSYLQAAVPNHEGDEVSSTYEGRHITATAAELVHAGAVVTKGQPVVFGIAGDMNGVGIAFTTEVAVTDLIAVDTEGIWMVEVLGVDDQGNSLVRGGEALYINTNTCVVSKLRNNATQIPFGYALGQVNGGDNDIIAVKVHWDPRSHWLLDQEKLFFGDGTEALLSEGDVSIEWDETIPALVMLPLTDNIGAFNIGNGTRSMDVQIFGATANDYLLWDNSEGTLDLVNTALAPSDRALSVAVTMALPQGEGLTGFFEATLTGLQAGLTYGLYSWLTLGGTFVATGTVTTPLETGIYTGGANLAAARLIFGAQHQAILDSVPLSYYPWRINVSAGAGSITALIQAGNIQSVGYIAAVTQNDPPIGYIPIAFIAGIAACQPGYVRVYADTD